MNYKEKHRNEEGITLIALIISIIILIILAMVAINAIYEFKVVDIAVNGAVDYAKEANNENEILDKTADFLDVTTNKKPVIEYLNITEKTTSSLTIKAKASDENNEELTYILYFGKSKEEMQALEEKKILQGTEVTWENIGLEDNAIYFYRLDVKDKYVTVTSQVKEGKTDRINTAPVLGNPTINKTTSSVTITAKASDADGDKIKYTIYFGETEENLIEEMMGIGTEILFTKEELTEYTNYYYRIDVEDEWDKTEGRIGIFRTYCPGNEFTCNEIICYGCYGVGEKNRCTGTTDSAISTSLYYSGTAFPEYIGDPVYKCSKCNLPVFIKGNDRYWHSLGGDPTNHRCVFCNGNGLLPCTVHNLRGEHSYCSHR